MTEEETTMANAEEKLDEATKLQRVMTVKSGHGKCGSYTYDDRCLYIGDFDAQGIKSGLGHLEAPNGSTFDGQFEKGLPNGVGIMRFPDSSRYEGEFMQGWFHGHGVFATIAGVVYEGEFRGGRIWGLGRIAFDTNEKRLAAAGAFRDNKFVADDAAAASSVLRARCTAAYAKRLCSEMCFDDNWIRPLNEAADEHANLESNKETTNQS